MRSYLLYVLTDILMHELLHHSLGIILELVISLHREVLLSYIDCIFCYSSCCLSHDGRYGEERSEQLSQRPLLW